MRFARDLFSPPFAHSLKREHQQCIPTAPTSGKASAEVERRGSSARS